MRLSYQLNDFIIHCKIKGLLPNTINNYSEKISYFITWCSDIDITDLNYDHVKRYTLHLIDKGLSPATIDTYLRNIKVLFRYLESDNIIQDPFSFKIKRYRSGQKIVTILSAAQIDRLFSACTSSRNRAIIALMLDSGLRQSEVVLSNYKDVNFDSGYMLVHGKGNKDRFVPVSSVTLDYINQYRLTVPDDLQNRALFLSAGNRITNNAIKLMVTKLNKKLDFDISCHKLRHNFATQYIIREYQQRGFADVYKLMSLMGHEDLATTKRYLHIANNLMIASNNSSNGSILDDLYKVSAL